MKKTLYVLALMLWSLPALAGEQTGTVNHLLVRASDGLVYFYLEGSAKTNSPACARNDYWMIRDENSEVGKKQYAMLLAAQASGKRVKVVGLNTCQRWGDGEDVNFIQLLNN
ncbi:hypothetical protein ABC502_02980 [Alkalimonas sp. NCh-2]|uniref:hypothetical protein n=1 Tax=Alkalimonas sp. NCh-2 TaxID=3144846 RepID=UPI0031F64D47